VIAKFTLDKEAIERATRSFIDTSFKKLRSAEGAFELLQNFKSIKSEGAINRQMMDKFNDILAQFSREIDATRELFELRAQAPPATRNQPPVAGAISWARSLFGRVRKTMQKLDGDLLSEEAGHEVHKNYVSLAKQMLAFEKSWFGGWSCSVDQLAMTHLKQSILRRESDGQAVVNFHPDLTRIMRETRYLDRMGFKIPEMALNITLQVGTQHPTPSTVVKSSPRIAECSRYNETTSNLAELLLCRRENTTSMRNRTLPCCKWVIVLKSFI
jgi:dynein heavy chain